MAYLLDLDAWSIYSGEKADYAIGGPTLELFYKSYNIKYDAYYIVQFDGDNYYMLCDSSYTLDDLYGLTHGQAVGMLMPSVRGINGYAVSLGLLRSGSWESAGLQLYFDSDLDMAGLRPIVCLSNKVQFAVKKDNALEIVDEPAS